jgi:hypothetical protein
MLTIQELEQVVRTSATKREVVARTGITASGIGSRLVHRKSPLRERWRRLPADGVFGRGGPPRTRGPSRLPRPNRSQAHWDATMAEALAEHPLDPTRNQRWNITRALWAVYYVLGTMDWSRGWVRPLMSALAEAGVPQSTAASVRWYRISLHANPEVYASSCPSEELMRDLADAPLA